MDKRQALRFGGRWGGVMCVAMLVLAGCGARHQIAAHPACDVSWIKEDGRLSPQRVCELRALSLRCAVSDQCQISCEANGGLPHVGGGCAHVCQGGGAGQTDEDIRRNGGPYDTDASTACYNRAR